MRAVQTKRICAGEQICAHYGLAIDGGQCVKCGSRLPRDAQGCGGHTWETPPAGWAAVHRRYGKTYWVHVASGRSCWPEEVRRNQQEMSSRTTDVRRQSGCMQELGGDA